MINKILCVECKEWKGISKDRLENNLEKFGSFEELIVNYLCRSCRGNGSGLNEELVEIYEGLGYI